MFRFSKVVYWTHFGIAVLGHICGVLLPITLFVTVFSYSGPWYIKSFFFSVAFLVSVLGVNHMTNPSSLCALTTLENFFRRKEGESMVGEFMPRFYTRISGWLRLKGQK